MVLSLNMEKTPSGLDSYSSLLIKIGYGGKKLTRAGKSLQEQEKSAHIN